MKLKNMMAVYQVPDSNKKIYGVIVEQSGSTLTVSGRMPGDTERINELNQKIEIDIEDVLAFLPSNPSVGTYAGVKVEPLIASKTLGPWGETDYYIYIKPEENQVLTKALKKTYKELKKRGLWKEDSSRTLEIRTASGKYAGYFKSKGMESIIALKPSAWDPDYLYSILVHEYAHYLEFYGMPPKLKAEWVMAYHTYCEVASIKGKHIDQLKKEQVTESTIEGGLGSFIDNLSERDALIMDEVFAFIDEKHGVDFKALDILVKSEKSIESFWPETGVTLTDWSSPLGDYATKSWSEFWAEAFRFHMSGNKLPKSIRKLMDKTVEKISSKLAA